MAPLRCRTRRFAGIQQVRGGSWWQSSRQACHHVGMCIGMQGPWHHSLSWTRYDQLVRECSVVMSHGMALMCVQGLALEHIVSSLHCPWRCILHACCIPESPGLACTGIRPVSVRLTASSQALMHSCISLFHSAALIRVHIVNMNVTMESAASGAAQPFMNGCAAHQQARAIHELRCSSGIAC